MKRVTVSDRGQVALPVSVLRRTGIRPGDQLLVSCSGAQVTLRKREGRHARGLDELWLRMEAIWKDAGMHGAGARLLRERRRDARKEARRV